MLRLDAHCLPPVYTHLRRNRMEAGGSASDWSLDWLLPRSGQCRGHALYGTGSPVLRVQTVQATRLKCTYLPLPLCRGKYRYLVWTARCKCTVKYQEHSNDTHGAVAPGSLIASGGLCVRCATGQLTDVAFTGGLNWSSPSQPQTGIRQQRTPEQPFSITAVPLNDLIGIVRRSHDSIFLILNTPSNPLPRFQELRKANRQHGQLAAIRS